MTDTQGSDTEPPLEFSPPPREVSATEVVWEIPPEASDIDGGDLDGSEVLYGATLSAGGLDPVPVLAIAGVDVASGPGPDGAPAGALVVDGLSIRWGRSEVVDQPTPATGSVTLFDPSRTWALATDRLGLPVTLRWSGGGGVPASGFGSTVFFRGRIADVQVAPKTVIYPDGTVVAGALVTLPLTSILQDLANRKVIESWPVEPMGTRRSRLATLMAATIPGLVYLSRPYWATPDVGPVPAARQVSLLEHVVTAYNSSGADRMTYWPPDNYLLHLPRRFYPELRGVAGLWWEDAGAGTSRAGQGVYVRSYGLLRAEAQAVGLPMFLDGAGIGYERGEGFQRGMSGRITRTEVTHPSSADAYNDRTVTKAVPGLDESAVGVRTASLDAIVAWNLWADLIAEDLADFVRREGTAWRLKPIRWRTKLTGGFENNDQLNTFLYGGETSANVFIQRSWLPGYGIRPVFGIMGQVISYRNGGWELECDLAPVVTSLPQHAITWEEIDDGTPGHEVQWWDEDHPQGMHESLTYEDLGYASTGLGVTTIPPNTGWDQIA
jgi:hypothetical protein